MSKDLSWDNHISITVNKANNLLGLIKRSVGTTNVNIFSTLYLSLVRPILEYAVPVWCPYLVKDIRALESVQRKELLKWLSPSDRRNYLSLIKCYKFVFGYYHLNFYDFFEFSKVGQQQQIPPSNCMLKAQD